MQVSRRLVLAWLLCCRKSLFKCVVVIALLAPLAAQAGCLRGEWYSVKPNGKLSTRPAYTLVDGVLVKSKERAPVGATCDLTKPTKPSNKDLYASYDSTGSVALCSKR